MVKTGEQVKQELWAQGSNLKKWAAENNYDYRAVGDVIRGRNHGTYGRGHEIAVKLGMQKPHASAN